MGMKVSVYDFSKTDRPIANFKNNRKGIKDFVILLNEELRKHGSLVQIEIKD